MTAFERGEWLELRKSTIGASEAAVVCGVSPYQSPLDLYYRKTGALPPVAETMPMRIGTLMEPVVLALYEAETGETVERRQDWIRSPEHDWMSATIDGAVLRDGAIAKPVECKTANIRMRSEWGDAGTDEIPLPYLIQVHHQMIVTATDVADVAVLIGNSDFRVYTIRRHDRLCRSILTRETEFAGCLRDRRPPPERPDDLRVFAALAPTTDAEVALEGNSEAVAWADEYMRLGPRIKAMEELRNDLKYRLIRSMAHHASARLDDGTVLARRTVKRPEYVAKATEYVDFRVKTPRTEDRS